MLQNVSKSTNSTDRENQMRRDVNEPELEPCTETGKSVPLSRQSMHEALSNSHRIPSGNAEKTDNGPASWSKTITKVVSEQWFLIALGILIAIASQVQVPLAHQELKRTVTAYLCISIIFFVYASKVLSSICVC